MVFVLEASHGGFSAVTEGLLLTKEIFKSVFSINKMLQKIEKCLIEPQCEFIAGALLERLLVDCLSVVASLLIPYVRALFCSVCMLYNQRDATYTMFFIIISAVHVSGGFSVYHQELIKLYVQPWVLSCFPAVYRWCE